MFKYYVIIGDRGEVFAVGTEEQAKNYISRTSYTYQERSVNIFHDVESMKKNIALDPVLSRMGDFLTYYEIQKTQYNKEKSRWETTDLKVAFFDEQEAINACQLFDETSGSDRMFTYKETDLPILYPRLEQELMLYYDPKHDKAEDLRRRTNFKQDDDFDMGL